MEDIIFYAQVYTSYFSETSDKISDDKLSHGMRAGAHFIHDVNRDHKKFVKYYKRQSDPFGIAKYYAFIELFPYEKVSGTVVKHIPEGILVKVPNNIKMFSYTRGPTGPMKYVILLDNGYMFSVFNINEYEDELSKNMKYTQIGHTLKWSYVPSTKEPKDYEIIFPTPDLDYSKMDLAQLEKIISDRNKIIDLVVIDSNKDNIDGEVVEI